MRTPPAALLGALLAGVLLAACSSPFESERPPEHFVRQARAVLGPVDFTLFHVASHGLLRDRQYAEALRSGARPDDLPEQLAALLARGAEGPFVLAVGGGSSEKTTAVLVAAFAEVTGLDLHALDLVVLCDAQHEDRVRHATRPSGCALRIGDLDG